MKILLLTDGIYPFSMGGMQKHSFYLLSHLHQLGHKVYVAHCVYGETNLPDNNAIQKELGVPAENVHSFHFPKSISIPGHYIISSKKYSKLLYRHFKNSLDTFDIIYTQGFTAWHFLKKTKKGKRPPIIVNLHGVEMYQPAFTKREKAEKQLLRIPANYIIKKADYLQSLGGKLTPLLLGLSGKDNIWECGIGIENSWIIKEAKPVNTPIRFVFVGRYEQRKGIHLLSPVLEELAKANKDFTVDFIGPIPEEKQLSGEQFTYHGKVTEETKIQDILDTCDVLLLPSLSEGMPTVVLEAMSRGLAILATDVGAVKNMVDDSNGWVIKPGDKKELRTTIQSILSSETESIQQKKAHSLEKVKSFAWQKMIQQHVAFFEKIAIESI